VRVNFLYFKVFKWGKLIWGSDGDFRFHFFRDKKKNQNLKTHVTKEKKAGRKKRTIIPGIVGFLFRQATLIDSKE
jgi:hypothetical protein